MTYDGNVKNLGKRAGAGVTTRTMQKSVEATGASSQSLDTMRAGLAANTGLHAIAGLCCFFPFWLITYGTYEKNWQGAYELNVWMPVVKVGFGCAIAAFMISFLGSKYICARGPKWIPAVAFALGFILLVLGSLAHWGNEDGQWKLSVVGLPLTLTIFASSYWGSSVGSRTKAPVR